MLCSVFIIGSTYDIIALSYGIISYGTILPVPVSHLACNVQRGHTSNILTYIHDKAPLYDSKKIRCSMRGISHEKLMQGQLDTV